MSVLSSARTALLALLTVAALASCRDTPTFQNLDVTGSKSFNAAFSLTDHNGSPRTLADFRGKVVVLFFGYAYCPDICPTTLAKLHDVMNKLGKDADRVQVLFVTVDPQRDTQELLAHYIPAFDARFLGLRPDSDDALQSVATNFRVFHAQVQGGSPGHYTVDHTAGSYMLDPQGHLRLFIRYGSDSASIVHDIKLLLP